MIASSASQFGKNMKLLASCHSILSKRYAAVKTVQEPGFGLLFDIDGVLIRGKKPISAAKKALKRLTDKNGNFCVPTVFVTNAGNALAQTKADQLSKALNVQITSDPIIMAHSPLRMFRQYHNKCVLLCGQGPVEKIAEKIGFTNTVTVHQIRAAFPNLDMVDHERRPVTPLPSVVENFPKIDAIVLFGEPVRWETNLQLIIDVLMTHGKLTGPMCEFNNDTPHLPVLACNMDLLWMAESHMPRFAHGTFLHCLESIFQKLVGRPLTYSVLMGKPSEITYHYAERVVMRQAVRMGIKRPIKTLYAVGDNPMADIYGANLYNRKLKEARELAEQIQSVGEVCPPTPNELGGYPWNQITLQPEMTAERQVTSCKSVLVCTGIYSQIPEKSHYQIPPSFHGPRDVEIDMSLCVPSHITQNLDTALDYIAEVECFRFRKA